MKKIMTLLITALIITVGCATTKTVEPERVRPAWIQYFDAKFAPNGVAKIIDWRYDDRMAFLWIDKLDTPEPCDHVAIMQIVDLNTTPPVFASLLIINKNNVKPGLTPCEAGYGAWADYLKMKATLENKERREGGI